jgi:hypothetical protein
MAIDWTKYEGYREDMTPAEKLALIESEPTTDPAPAVDPAPAGPAPRKPELKVEPKAGYVSKAQFDKTASELAALKKQMRARMSEEEIKAEEARTAHEAMEQELTNLRREKTISGHKATFLSLGYDETEADKMAIALTDGETDELFAGMKRRGITAEKAMREKILKETPVPPAGTDPTNAEKEAKNDAEWRKAWGLSAK